MPLTDTMNCAGLKGNSQPNPVYGYGRINVLAAVEAALKMTTPVDTPTQQKIAMQITPNPVTEGTLQLELGAIPYDGRLELLDATGRLIQQHTLPQAKFQTKTLTLSPLPAGTYIVRITAGNAFGYQRIVKI